MGFKPGHGTDMCTFLFKETVTCYVEQFGVKQGGVLSPYLFALYKNLIMQFVLWI